MNLLFPKKPLAEESLSSYIQRAANSNYASSHDLWRLCSLEGAHYPQATLSSVIDVFPDKSLNIETLSILVGESLDSLRNMTFIPAHNKFGISNEKVGSSRVLSDMLQKSRCYCPLCIAENHYYKLMWQVKEVSFCKKHNILLQSRCSKCGKCIPIIPVSSEMGTCPYCHSQLSQSPVIYHEITCYDARDHEDWSYLLSSTEPILAPIESLSSEQNIAMRLLYVAETHCESLDQADHDKLPTIQQIARDTRATQTFIHISTILNILRESDISLREFFTMDIPNLFVEKIHQSKKQLITNYSCIAPWCNSYQNRGELYQTSTSVRERISGENLKYYMYCRHCGLEYALTKNNDLLERGTFIDFAWSIVLPELHKGHSFVELSRKLDCTQDKLKRAIIFLAANGLIDPEMVPIQIPFKHDPEVVSKIKHYVNNGIPSKKIRLLLKMNYNDFLYYWLSAEIRVTNIEKALSRPGKSTNKDDVHIRLDEVVCKLMDQNCTITVKKICHQLNVCPETLRHKKLLTNIRESKAKQKKLREDLNKVQVIEKTDTILRIAREQHSQLSSEMVYKELGVCRNVLVRNHPELTEYIHKKLVEYRKFFL